jgi:hypothetical protein
MTALMPDTMALFWHPSNHCFGGGAGDEREAEADETLAVELP